MKRIVSIALVTLTLLGILPLGMVHAQAEESVAVQNELRDWYYGDPITGEELYGQAALDKMGGMDAILLELETQDDTGGTGEDSPYMGITPSTALTTQLDMSVYDVLGFKNKSAWTKKDGTAVISSTYQAAEYFMYGIMSGTGWQATAYADPWGGGWDGVYYIVFTPDVDLPWELRNSILGPLGEFIFAYFPHYFFSVGSTLNGRYGEDGKSYVANVTYAIGHNPTSDAASSMNWKEEWDEALALMEKDVSGTLGSGNTPINSGTDAEKLKKAHDYIALISTYSLNEQPHMGQRAYCALIEHTPVCNGYALAYSMLCLRMGLDVPYMSGYAGGAHAWNLNLTSYPELRLTDVTWDDQPGAPGGIIYEYYNQPLDDFRSERTWNQYYESYIAYVHGNKDNIDDRLIYANMALGNVAIVPSSNSGATIDLATETINLGGFSVAAYSLNGGTKWTKGALPADAVKFSKLFDKEMTLWLSDTYNERDVKEGGVTVAKKGVPDSASIIKFPKIEKRPKANDEKLAAYYADSTWTLMTKPTKTVEAAAPKFTYEYAKGNTTDGKLPTDAAWLTSPENGFGIISKPDKSDKSKNVYYFRSLPSAAGGTYTPGSKSFKISPAYYGAALKYKIDYKTEVLKLKKGEQYSIDGGNTWLDVTLENNKPVPLNVSDYITSGTNISVKKAAIGTKPRTDVQTIAPVGRALLSGKTLTCAKGKITDTVDLKKYEILGKDSKGNDKWGNLPKITESKEFDIRLKTDAKLTKDVWGGNAASATGKLVITYGVYDDSGKTPKSGITKAEIFPAGYKPGPTDADKIALAKATIEAISGLKAGSSTVFAKDNENEAWNAAYARVQELYEGGSFPEGVTVECAGSAKNGTDFYSVTVTIRCGNASDTADAKVAKNNSSAKVTISGNTSATGFVLNFDMSIFTGPGMIGGIGGVVNYSYTYTGTGSLTEAKGGGGQFTPTITFAIADAAIGDTISLNIKYYDDKSLPVVVPEVTWNGTTWSLAS